MAKRHDDRFFRVPTATRLTSEGPISLPILYFDVVNVVAMFDAPLAGASLLLEGTGLTPAVVGGRAAVALSFYEYLDTSVGVYNEVGIAILATRRGEAMPRLGWADMMVPPPYRTLGAYVVDLPVTTAVANAAGREIWGYPKFVTDIAFRLHGREFEGVVADPSGAEPILTLAGRMGPGVPAPALSVVTYTLLDGELVRTHIDVRGAVSLSGPGTLRAHAGASSHPMADHARALGLDGARPRLVLSTRRFQSKLHAGTKLGVPAK